MVFYHLSKKQLNIGFVLRASNHAWFDNEVEAILREARPSGELARGNCIYMLKDQRFNLSGIIHDAGYIYELQPLEPVKTRDIFWIGQIQIRDKRGIPYDTLKCQISAELSKKELAEKYWSGAISDKPMWEHVTSAAEVIRYVGPWARHQIP